MECMPVINQKGGVGKTATSVNLGAALAQRGKRMLLIDMDPQGHLTTHLGLDDQAKGAGIYEVLTRGFPLEAAIHTYSPTISVVPAQIDLAAAEVELIATVGREVILRDLLASQDWPFDIVMVDCPPSLGVLTLNALSAATQVLIPLQPHFLALQGVGKLFETIALVAQRINPRLRVAGMVMCLYEPATRLAGEVIADLTGFLEAARNSPVPWRNARLMETRIRRNVKLAECPSYGQSIFEYEPRSHGAIDYLALADELLAMLATGADASGKVVPAAPVSPVLLPPATAPKARSRPVIKPAAAVHDETVTATPSPMEQAQPAAVSGAKPPNAAPKVRSRPVNKPAAATDGEPVTVAPAPLEQSQPAAANGAKSPNAAPKARSRPVNKPAAATDGEPVTVAPAPLEQSQPAAANGAKSPNAATKVRSRPVSKPVVDAHHETVTAAPAPLERAQPEVANSAEPPDTAPKAHARPVNKPADQNENPATDRPARSRASATTTVNKDQVESPVPAVAQGHAVAPAN
jgi:chromosome partitioning protein